MKRTILILGTCVASIALSGCGIYPPYRVWAKRQDGLAELAQADGNRQIQIQEAKAAAESAQYTAEAEVTKARGVAQANQIMSQSLGGPEGYLRWKYIEMLQESKTTSQIIYVPTEAGLPILEAGKRADQK